MRRLVLCGTALLAAGVLLLPGRPGLAEDTSARRATIRIATRSWGQFGPPSCSEECGWSPRTLEVGAGDSLGSSPAALRVQAVFSADSVLLVWKAGAYHGAEEGGALHRLWPKPRPSQIRHGSRPGDLDSAWVGRTPLDLSLNLVDAGSQLRVATISPPRAIAASDTTMLVATVVDNLTSEPMNGLGVYVPGADLYASTDDRGRFELHGVPRGMVDLVFCGCHLRKRHFEVRPEQGPLTIRLSFKPD